MEHLFSAPSLPALSSEEEGALSHTFPAAAAAAADSSDT